MNLNNLGWSGWLLLGVWNAGLLEFIQRAINPLGMTSSQQYRVLWLAAVGTWLLYMVTT